MHSEFNPSPKTPVHLLQIWITPEQRGLKPAYEQLAFSDSELRGKFNLVAGPKAPVTIRQDADLYVARLDANSEASHTLEKGRHAWVQVARGRVTVNGKNLKAGDGAAISDEPEVRVTAKDSAEVLLFDLD
jgi:quercetin 2,3-dioxygenase